MAPEVKKYIDLMKKESQILKDLNDVNNKIIAELKTMIETQQILINLLKESLNIK